MRTRERIMWDTPHAVTADDLDRMPEDDYRYELVRGRLVPISPAAPRHGRITVTLVARLWQHVRPRQLGEIWTEVGFRLASNPDTVRAPDVSFVHRDRLRAEDAKGFYRGAPDLAIEVLSPDDPPREIREKLEDYFTAGARLVVVVDPQERKVIVHRPGAAPVTLGSEEALDLTGVIEDFTLHVNEIFG